MKFAAGVLLCIGLISAVGVAQEATGRIIGTASDPSGAVIPNVQVTITNSATGISRKTTTDHDGYYQVLALPIGTYKVAAEHEGFRRVISEDQKLLINQALRVDVHMEVG